MDTLNLKIDAFLYAIHQYRPDIEEDDVELVKALWDYVSYEAPFDTSDDEIADIVSTNLELSKGYVLDIVNNQ